MTRGTGSYGNGYVCHPHVLLVDAVGNPEVGVVGHAVASQRVTQPSLAVGCTMSIESGKNAAHVLRAVRLVVAAIAHRRDVAMHKVQGLVVESVGREADGEWPTELRGVIHRSVHAVGEALSPNLGVRIDETGSTMNEAVPRHATILRVAGERVFPQGDERLAVGQGVVVERLVFVGDGEVRILAVTLLDELHPIERRREDFFDSLAELLVLRLGVEGEVGV